MSESWNSLVLIFVAARIRSRLLGGEILEVPIGEQFGYFQFLGRHRQRGDAILVSPMLHSRQCSFSAGFFATGYVTFYPACLAVTRKLIEVVAQSPPPKIPTRYRRPAAQSRDGRVESWVIEGGWREVVRTELSEEERCLPISGVWDHEFLSKQIAKRWTPQTDGR